MKSEQTNDISRFARAAGAFVVLAFVFALGLTPSAAFAGELDGNQTSGGEPAAVGAAANAEGVPIPGEEDNANEPQAASTTNGATGNVQETGSDNLLAAASDDGILLAAAEENTEWEFNVSDDVVELTYYKNKDATEVTVPNEIAGYEGRSVVINKIALLGMESTLEKVVFSPGVKIKDGEIFFAGFTALKTVDVSGLDLSECTSMKQMFYGAESMVEIDLSGLDASSCESMDGMFGWCTSLTTVNAANLKLNTTGPLSMHTMFEACENLSELDTTNWDTSGVTTMESMFDSCKQLTKLDVSKWNTGSVTTMQSMFNNCESLAALDVSKWNTGSVTTMQGMFNNCKSLAALDVSKWNTGSVTTMEGMFNNCESLSALDVSNWDVSIVKSFRWAFYGLPGTTVLDVRKWNANAVELVDDGYGNMVYGGWAQAFSGPLVLVSDGQMAQRAESGNDRADGKYIGIDANGFYGIFLEDSMDRVWCLNWGISTPEGNLYTKDAEQLDETGLQRLSTVFRSADTQMSKEERWKKIAAAITFYGNVLDTDVQEALQWAIWYYSDDLISPADGRQGHLSEDAQAIVDYIEANWQSLDYSGLKINFYDSGTNPIEPGDDGTYDGKYQNLISLSTAETVRHKGAGSIKISKEIATGSDADTTQVFTFTIKLKNADGTPYVMFVQAASEGEELHAVAPSQDGIITLNTTGAGEAIIDNLRPGTTYEIVEESVDGWTLVDKSGEKGTVEEDTASKAIFTNAEKGKEHLANTQETKEEKKAETKADKATAAKTGMVQTGDTIMVWPLLALVLVSLATFIVAWRKRIRR